MSNPHFGEIGDVWKHLVLAEVLALEAPLHYWESHAGSARYDLTHALPRDYGVFYFLNHANTSELLKNSAYYRILSEHQRNSELAIYPGSPLIAMTLLKEKGASFLFCDIDKDSLVDIMNFAYEIGLPSYSIRTVHADGVATLSEHLDRLFDQHVFDTFAFIDPYRPFVKSYGGYNSIGLFCRLTIRGVRAMLWYSYSALEYRTTLLEAIRSSFVVNHATLSRQQVWCGDVNLLAMDDPTFDTHVGTLGCGVLCSNLSSSSISVCQSLGFELMRIYHDALFPSGHTGAIRFAAAFL